jgi:predicted nicotinamide N-methyase
MPRQGARAARRAAARTATPGSKRKACVDGAEVKANDRLQHPIQAVCERGVHIAADFEAALAAPGDTAEKLFELANKPMVRFTVGGHRVEVSQDRKATEHSGGVVWETAFFLARYIERHLLQELRAQRSPDCGTRLRVVELGSGCGLLGLALSQLGCNVLLTEQPAALPNLSANVKAASKKSCGAADVAQLSWGDDADISAVLKQGPFDLVVASDVVFAERFVDPLLRTISAMLENSRSESRSQGAARKPSCWLCLQQRDPDAHAALLQRATALFRMRELDFTDLPGFEAAVELECVLLHLRPLKNKGSTEAAAQPSSASTPCASDILAQRRRKRTRT